MFSHQATPELTAAILYTQAVVDQKQMEAKVRSEQIRSWITKVTQAPADQGDHVVLRLQGLKSAAVLAKSCEDMLQALPSLIASKDLVTLRQHVHSLGNHGIVSDGRITAASSHLDAATTEQMKQLAAAVEAYNYRHAEILLRDSKAWINKLIHAGWCTLVSTGAACQDAAVHTADASSFQLSTGVKPAAWDWCPNITTLGPPILAPKRVKGIALRAAMSTHQVCVCMCVGVCVGICVSVCVYVWAY